MWDEGLAALVDELERLQDEKELFDANDNEMTEISERMTYSSELVDRHSKESNFVRGQNRGA